MDFPETSYSPLGWRKAEDASRFKALLKNATLFWKDVLLVLLTGFVSVLMVMVFRQRINQIDEGYIDRVSYPDQWTQYTWWSKYSSAETNDVAAVDSAWDAIIPAHGLVAVDHTWAASKRLPDTMSLPSDKTKGVYIIDAYHQLHCLTIVRKTFSELVRGDPLTFPAGHSTHCFDSIRQYIMCTAGETLLYTWGRNETGDGQLRKCRDWTALRDWATANSACYRDSVTPIPINDHFGHCDGGTDGIAMHGW